MDNAVDLILKALDSAEKITPAGKTSMLAIAARTLDPEAPLTRKGISQALGLHPDLVIAVLVTADQAGDSLSRRDLARELFPRLPLQATPPGLTSEGHVQVAIFCLARLKALAELLGEMLERALAQAEALTQGRRLDPVVAKQILEDAEEMQRTKLVQLAKGHKSKLGVPDAEVTRRRAAQAARAFIDGCGPEGNRALMSLTVAGEVAGALATGVDMDAATSYCLDLADFLAQLPSELSPRAPKN